MEATKRNDNEVTKRAVLIGIDNYQLKPQQTNWPSKIDKNGSEIIFSNLRGCVNDVLAVSQYLVGTMKIEPRHIEYLLCPGPSAVSPYAMPEKGYREPTYKNIVTTLEHLARDSNAGDVVYIHYSGHGACATTVFGDLRRSGDGIDHCLVPSDIAQGGKYLRDLELGALLQEVVEKGVVLTVVLDSCHSGGAVRGEDDDDADEDVRGIRGICHSNEEIDLPNNMERVRLWALKGSWMESPKGFVVLAACLDYQKAKEFTCKPEDKDPYRHGVLTYWLLDTLRNTAANLSTRAIYDRVRARVSWEAATQTPYLVGDADRFFFSKKLRTRVCTLSVNEVFKIPLSLNRRWVRLGGGRMDGVHEGSVYAILRLDFDPGKKIEESNVLARVRVEGMSSSACRAFFIEPEKMSDEQWSVITEGCPAVLERLLLERMATVRFLGNDDAQAIGFESRWDHHVTEKAKLRLVNREDAHFSIHVDDLDNFQIDHQGEGLPPHIHQALVPLPWKTESSIPKLIARLEHLARFRFLKGLENPGTKPGKVSELVSVTVTPSPEGRYWYNGDDEEIWFPPADQVALQIDGTYRVQEKSWFRFAITNNTGRTIGCVLLNFNPELGIDIMHWEPFHSILPYQIHHEDLFVQIPDSLRDAANGGIPIVDAFKVFVTVPEKDLSAMTLPKLRDMEKKDGNRCHLGYRELDDLLGELDPPGPWRNGPNGSSVQWDTDWQTVDVHVQAVPS